MKLIELLGMMSDSANIRVTVDNTYIVAYYDGRDSIGMEYEDYEVVSMSSALVRGKSYISVDVTPTFYIEIWWTPDGDDWAKVNVNKETGLIEDIQASGWDACGDMTREEAMALCAESGGYTEFDPYTDVYQSYEEWNDWVSTDGEYEYL